MYGVKGGNSMKEKDIVDFSKMEETEDGFVIDEDGNEIGCKICHTHEKAFEILSKKQVTSKGKVLPLCPKCGNVLSPLSDSGYEYGTVSEVNYSNPDGEIGLYEFYHCDVCLEDSKLSTQQNYALMPIRIVHNANHGIHYTGGRDYAEDEDIEKLIDAIFEGMKGSIQQYVERKLNPKNDFDKMLDMSNVMLWSKRDVESAVCNWLYERGLKK